MTAGHLTDPPPIVTTRPPAPKPRTVSPGPAEQPPAPASTGRLSLRSTSWRLRRSATSPSCFLELTPGSAHNSPDFWAVVDEAVLRRAVGGHAVMVEQLAALLPHVDTGRTTIQVVPFARCEGPLMRGTLTFLTLPDNSMGLYEEGDEIWDVFEDRQTVTPRLWQYDRMKACALSPSASASFIEAAIEDHRHASDPCPYPHPLA